VVTTTRAVLLTVALTLVALAVVAIVLAFTGNSTGGSVTTVTTVTR
jgi:hypothetical protein